MTEHRYRALIRRTPHAWQWTVFDTSKGDPVAAGYSRSQRTALIAAESFLRHRPWGNS